MKRCPRCSSEISVLDKVCPRCGLAVSKMEEYKKSFAFDEENENNVVQSEENKPLSKKELKRKEKEEKKARKKAEKEANKKYVSDTDFTQYATNSGVENQDEIFETDTYMERKKKKKKQQAKPVFEIDENGEFNIDTKEVEIVGEKTGKIIEERYEQSYSVKKSRGDYIPPKIKWWEIYKLADRHFARSKIKKEVNKAAKIKPSFVKKSKLLLLSIFLGWTGAQNFYAKNKRKGWVSIFTLAIWIIIVYLSTKFKFFASISTSIGGGSGFICVFIWISDIINVITNQFRYRVQIDKFISSMNVETRAKLGEKYIDLELYHSPWWVRFRAWCQKLNRNYHEYQKDRRQRIIDKQKRKLAEMEEKAKIERDIAEFEAKEERKLKGENAILSQSVLNELNSFSDDNHVEEIKHEGSEENEQESSKLSEEKIEPFNEEVVNEEESVENNEEKTVSEEKTEEVVEPKRERKVGNLQSNKYAKFSNKKSSKKKKKK